MAISILPVGSTTKNKEWWVALNKGFVYDIMDFAMKKAGMYDTPVSEKEKYFEHYLNYDRYEPPRIYCVEDGVPLIYLSSYSYTDRPNKLIKKEPIENESDFYRNSSEQADNKSPLKDNVNENKLDRSLSEKMHHLDIKVPPKDAEVVPLKYNSSILPHRPTPLKRRYVPNTCSLSFNYKVARNSQLDYFQNCKEIVEPLQNISPLKNSELNNCSSIDYSVHSRHGASVSPNSNIALNRGYNAPNKFSPISDCSYCSNSNQINLCKDHISDRENMKIEYLQKCKNIVSYEHKLEKNDDKCIPDQHRNKSTEETKISDDILRDKFRSTFCVPHTVKQCKGTTVYGNDGQIYKQFDGSICDMKNQSVISITDTISGSNNDNEQHSPKLGWVAVSKEDVNHILEAVVESMINEEEIEEREEDPICLDKNLNKDVDNSSHLNPIKDEEGIISHNVETVITDELKEENSSLDSDNGESPQIDSLKLHSIKCTNSSDSSTSNVSNVVETSNKIVNPGDASSSKSDKVFKWKSYMLERVNEESALNNESVSDDIPDSTMVRRTKTATTGTINK